MNYRWFYDIGRLEWRGPDYPMLDWHRKMIILIAKDITFLAYKLYIKSLDCIYSLEGLKSSVNSIEDFFFKITI